jgi:hypothetical protein
MTRSLARPWSDVSSHLHTCRNHQGLVAAAALWHPLLSDEYHIIQLCKKKATTEWSDQSNACVYSNAYLSIHQMRMLCTNATSTVQTYSCSLCMQGATYLMTAQVSGYSHHGAIVLHFISSDTKALPTPWNIYQSHFTDQLTPCCRRLTAMGFAHLTANFPVRYYTNDSTS